MRLKYLSNEELVVQIKSLVARERELLIEILHHLKEIDSRKLFLKLGYSSLWAYCTRELGYSEASAQRRIEAMRALRDMPTVEAGLQSGALNLSTLARAQSVMRRVGSEKKLQVFVEIQNKTQRQTEAILISHFGVESVTPVEKVRQVSVTQSKVEMTVSQSFTEKSEIVKNIFSHRNPHASLAETIEMAFDFVISKRAVKVSEVRTTEVQKYNAPPPPQRQSELPSLPKADLTPQSRRTYIPVDVKREVWRDAGGKCQFKDQKSGRQCASRFQLEIEHIKPVVFGGRDERENLRLYCRAHNTMAAREATLMA